MGNVASRVFNRNRAPQRSGSRRNRIQTGDAANLLQNQPPAAAPAADLRDAEEGRAGGIVNPAQNFSLADEIAQAQEETDPGEPKASSSSTSEAEMKIEEESEENEENEDEDEDVQKFVTKQKQASLALYVPVGEIAKPKTPVPTFLQKKTKMEMLKPFLDAEDEKDLMDLRQVNASDRRRGAQNLRLATARKYEFKRAEALQRRSTPAAAQARALTQMNQQELARKKAESRLSFNTNYD